MPTVFTEKGIRFFFYSNENEEPVHVHVEKGKAIGKIWLQPVVKIAYLNEFTRKEERQIMEIISTKKLILKEKWNEHFSQ